MISSQVTDGIVNTMLRQMGAVKIKTPPAYINIVTFRIEDEFEIQYVYEMKENDTIYLQRVTPYPYFLGEPENSDELIAMIKEDLDGYVNAYESDNFPLYMEISDKAELARKKLEKLLLGEKYANPEDLKHLSDMMSKVIDMFSLSENHTTDKKPVLKL